MNKEISEKSLAKKVRASLSPPVDKRLWDSLWANLNRRGFLDTAEYCVEEIVQEAQNLQEEFASSFQTSQHVSHGSKDNEGLLKQEKTLALRRQVLSEIFAKMAAEDEEVIAFREEVLDGKLLNWEEVKVWIQQQVQQEASENLPIGWLTVSLPLDSEDDSKKAGVSLPTNDPDDYLRVMRHKLRRIARPYKVGVGAPGLEKAARTLAYTMPGENWVLRKVARIGGTLDRLRELSESLAKYYGWDDAQATVFVLADVMPLVSMVRATYTVAPGGKRINGRLRQKPEHTRRITLEIDPTLTDKQVAKVYRQVRRKLLRKDNKGRAIYRPISEKHLKLAQFDIKQPEDRPAHRRMDLWNMEHRGEWKYNSPGNLNRDGRKAVDRLLNPRFSPPGS